MRLNLPKISSEWALSVPLLDSAFDRITAAFGRLRPDAITFVDASSAAVTKYLPDGNVVDSSYTYVKTDSSANAVTITAYTGQLVNAAASITLAAQGDSTCLVFDRATQTWWSV